MRRWLFGWTVVLVLGLAALAVTGVTVAYAQPFAPGDALYPVQVQAVRWVVPRLGADRQARWALDLLARHADWLAAARGTPEETAVLQSLADTLPWAAQRLSQVPPSVRSAYREDWTRTLTRVQQALGDLTYAPAAQPGLWEEAQARVDMALQAARPPQDFSDAALAPLAQMPVTRAAGAGQPIPFPTDFAARHEAFFPLTGKHARIGCQSCHAGGQFAGTASSCRSCHQAVRPADHWEGECSACHSTTAWRPATFDHQLAGATDCQACHAQDRPANHFQGQCSACHSTTAWRPASFDHQLAGATDCQACHTQDRPANHFQGQCSACHSTAAWRPASFDHQLAGATDCQACHAQDRPANHFQGQCSTCHNTTNWQQANFNHTFPIQHGGANGQCSVCHPSGTASYTCESCHSLAAMQAEHQEEGIFNIAGQCAACHAGGQGGDNEGGEYGGGDEAGDQEGGADENGGGSQQTDDDAGEDDDD